MSLLQTFINNYSLEKTNLSMSSLQLLNHIIDQLREIPPLLNNSRQKTKLLKGNLWDTIPLTLQSNIEILFTNSKQSFLYSLDIHNRNIQIYILGGSLKEQNYSIMLIHKYLSFILPFCPSHCTNNVCIFIYLLRDKKILPRSGGIIDVINVNTAFTTSCQSNQQSSEINIFRKEEWFKVLIHETFHIFGLDFSSMKNNMSVPNEILREMFHLTIEQDYRVYESYCEINAELLNILIATSIIDKTNRNKILRECISLEKTFSLFQWKKILQYYGLHLHRDLRHYREDISILSYYALKSIGLYYLEDFIQEFLVGKQNTFFFEKTNQNILKYCLFFKERYLRKDYLEALNKITIGDSLERKLKNTLRMTLIEL